MAVSQSGLNHNLHRSRVRLAAALGEDETPMKKILKPRGMYPEMLSASLLAFSAGPFILCWRCKDIPSAVTMAPMSPSTTIGVRYLMS